MRALYLLFQYFNQNGAAATLDITGAAAAPFQKGAVEFKKGVGSVGIDDFGQQVGFGVAFSGIAGAVGVIIAVSGSAAGRVGMPVNFR